MLSPPTPNETLLNLHYFSKKLVVQMGLGAKVSPNPAKENVGETITLCLSSKGKNGLRNRILAWTNDARPGFVLDKSLPPKPESSFRLKSFILGPLLTGILHKKSWPANPESKINLKLLTFQSSLKEIRGNLHILLSRLGVRDPARKVHAWFWLHQ